MYKRQLLFGALRFCQRLRLNGILQSMLASALAALAVMLMVGFGLGQNPDKIIIGNIMLLIPGTVSYTHLPGVTGMTAGMPELRMLLDIPGVVGIKMSDWNIFLLRSVVPVSYTHLDVYKRQIPPAWACGAARGRACLISGKCW